MGEALDRPGYFVQPTVLKNASADMSIVREEIFGPVVAAMPFGDDSEIVGQANDSALRLSRWHLDQRHFQGASVCQVGQSGHRVDQLLQYL